jgi:hypothetical protein
MKDMFSPFILRVLSSTLILSDHKTGCESVGWIHLAQDWVMCFLALVNVWYVYYDIAHWPKLLTTDIAKIIYTEVLEAKYLVS